MLESVPDGCKSARGANPSFVNKVWFRVSVRYSTSRYLDGTIPSDEIEKLVVFLPKKWGQSYLPLLSLIYWVCLEWGPPYGSGLKAGTLMRVLGSVCSQKLSGLFQLGHIHDVTSLGVI